MLDRGQAGHLSRTSLRALLLNDLGPALCSGWGSRLREAEVRGHHVTQGQCEGRSVRSEALLEPRWRGPSWGR